MWFLGLAKQCLEMGMDMDGDGDRFREPERSFGDRGGDGFRDLGILQWGWGPLNGNASWSRMKQDADAKSLEPVSSVVGGVGPTLHKSMHAQDSKIDPA